MSRVGSVCWVAGVGRVRVHEERVTQMAGVSRGRVYEEKKG